MRSFTQDLTRRLAIRYVQFSQARRIHGGLLRFVVAVIVVHLSRLPIPSRGLRERLFRDFYARAYPPGLNEEEAERPLADYPSLNALFTRGVKPEYRPIPVDPSEVLSPCDGKVQDVGRIAEGQLITAKGIAYSLSSLMPGMDTSVYEGGAFVVIFLSPIDCHRVFSPRDGRLEELVHVPGYRLLVHPPFQRPEYPVYTLNERMVFRLATDAGPCAVVMVAGWGVGHITVPLAPKFRPRSRGTESFTWESRPEVKRGDWLATFELGSTVVMLTSASHDANPRVSPNEKVRYGQPVFGFNASVANR